MYVCLDGQSRYMSGLIQEVNSMGLVSMKQSDFDLTTTRNGDLNLWGSFTKSHGSGVVIVYENTTNNGFYKRSFDYSGCYVFQSKKDLLFYFFFFKGL